MKKTVLLLLLLVTAILLSNISFTVSAVSDSPEVLDYGNPSSSNVEYKASEFIELLTGEAVSKVEAEYIDSVLGEAFAYSDAIPQKNVEVEYNNNVLTVTAKRYEYETESNGKVIWTPRDLSFDGEVIPMEHVEEDDSYRVVLKYIEESESVDISVTYICSIPLDSEKTDAYKNYAYNYAMQLWNENEAYKSALAKYNEDCAAYQKYLTDISNYNSDYEAWQKYLSEKEIYDVEYAKYLIYEAEMLEYSKKLGEYYKYISDKETYPQRLQEYKDYLVAKSEYDAAYKLYEEYMAVIQRAEAKLIIMESIYAKDSKGTQLYASIMGDAVDQVLANQDLLVSIGGCDPTDIKNAGDSTEALRILMREYQSKKTIEEKYSYYSEHYTEIRDNFIKLYGSLSALYKNPAVKQGLISKGKLERFIQFLSQLYVIATGLDDTLQRNPDWEIEGDDYIDGAEVKTHVYSYQELLEECQRPNDINDTDPSDLSLPAKVEKPELPTVVKEPTIPIPVEKPMHPDVVEKPTEPTVVDQPIKPDEVAEPGKEPEAVYYTPVQQSLIDAIDDGTIRERETGTAHTIDLESQIMKRVSLQNKCVVTFYDYDGKTVLAMYEIDKGSAIVFDGEEPTRESGGRYEYSFSGWLDDNGEAVEPGIANERYINFFASYSTSVKSYNITWVIDGEEFIEDYEYGAYPTFNGAIEKNADEQYYYTFVGWSDTIRKVDGDARYEAIFNKTLREYSVTWNFNGSKHVEYYKYGELPTYKRSTDRAEDSKYIYEFKGWDKEIEVVTANVEYFASFDAIAIVEDENGNAVEIKNQDGIYTAKAPGNKLRVDRLTSLANLRGKTVELQFLEGAAILSVNSTAIKDLIDIGCIYIYINEENPSYSIGFVDEAGESVALKYNVTLKTSLNGGANNATKAYLKEADGSSVGIPSRYENGMVIVKLEGSSELIFKNEYMITVGECNNGVLSVEHNYYESGSKVGVSLIFSDDYMVESISVIGDSGTVYDITEQFEFEMPEENVTVSAKLKLREFTVSFVVDGTVISSQKYHKGDSVVVPANPTKPDNEDKTYSFVYWSPSITTVTEDVTYTAVFKEAVKGGNDSYISDSNDRFYVIVTTAAIVLAAVIAAPIVIVVLLKKRKAKALKANSEAKTGDGDSKNTPSEETAESDNKQNDN